MSPDIGYSGIGYGGDQLKNSALRESNSKTNMMMSVIVVLPIYPP
jgi:hypothetical protein